MDPTITILVCLFVFVFCFVLFCFVSYLFIEFQLSIQKIRP